MMHNITTKLHDSGLGKYDSNLEDLIKKRAKYLFDDSTQEPFGFLREAANAINKAYSPVVSPSTSCHNAEIGFLKQLGTAISDQSDSAVFACGGEVPIGSYHDLKTSSVDIRWGSTASQGRLIQFRLPAKGDQSDCDSIQQLLVDCQPATFGRCDKDVLDESYRKAGKLDESQFCTNFNPHEYGIVDAIAQVLLPGSICPPPGSVNTCWKNLGVSAKLYKLNVRSNLPTSDWLTTLRFIRALLAGSGRISIPL